MSQLYKTLNDSETIFFKTMSNNKDNVTTLDIKEFLKEFLSNDNMEEQLVYELLLKNMLGVSNNDLVLALQYFYIKLSDYERSVFYKIMILKL